MHTALKDLGLVYPGTESYLLFHLRERMMPASSFKRIDSRRSLLLKQNYEMFETP